jgi:cytochrome P450
MQGWVITRYADCERIFKDDEAFSSDPGRAAGGLGESVRMSRGCAALGGAPILANTDPPEHTRLRAVLSRAFAAREMASRKPDVERTVRGLLADIPAGRPTDFMKALAEPLPLVVVLELLGIPPEDRGAFREAVVGIMRGRMEASANAAAAQASYIAGRNLRSLLLERGAREGVGLVARLAEEMEEGGLAEDELLMVVVHIATAGNAATAFALGNMLLALAQDPEVWSELRSDPELAPGAVDEALRYDSPTHITTRFALAETPLCGRKIRPGQAVHLVGAAANRDPEEFAEPDVFDIHRKSRQPRSADSLPVSGRR